MVESSGLLNRRRSKILPGVRIPPSPPFLPLKTPKRYHLVPFGFFLSLTDYFSLHSAKRQNEAKNSEEKKDEEGS